MHIEALAWSGMTARAYAKALGLSLYSLRRWQGLIDAGEAAEDWRALLHPSARATLSTSASSSAKESAAKSDLTNSQFEEPAPAKPRRRSFSAEEKLAIVLETERPGATVSQVAREHQIVTSVLFRWRAELGFGRSKPVKLAAVRIVDEPQNGKRGARTEPVALSHILPIPPDAVAVELADGRCVFAPAGSDPEVVRRYIDERENGRC
jgi:transposase-like protein